MPKLYGENYLQEWMQDPLAPEIKEAIILAENGKKEGISIVEGFAKNGSALASFLLGDIYLYGRYGATVDESLAEDWLKRSADNGSLEGRYRLAKYYERKGAHDLAIEHYSALAKDKFAPAMYILGYKYLTASGVEKDFSQAVRYLKEADKLGHLHAGHWLSHLDISEGRGILAKVRGFIKRIAIFFPFVYTKVLDPNSDRLRS
jgi:TPR repeat protein